MVLHHLVKMPTEAVAFLGAVAAFLLLHVPQVPTEAVAFLGAVAAFLLLLIIFFMYLNKVLCFSSCGGFPCIDRPPKKSQPKANRLGAAYAYENETSSDSDDEVLKRFKTSMEATVKRSNSRYSQHGGSPLPPTSPTHAMSPTHRSPEHAHVQRGPDQYSSVQRQKSQDRGGGVQRQRSQDRGGGGKSGGGMPKQRSFDRQPPGGRGSPDRVRHSSSKSSMRSQRSQDKSSMRASESMIVEDETGHRSPASSRPESPPTQPREEKLIDLGTPKQSPVHEPASSPHASSSGKATGSSGQSDAMTPGTDATTPLTSSVTTGSAHTLEGTQTYNNQAYDGLSVTESEQATDEHMFDVSDLQGEAPLISKCGSLEVTFEYDSIRSRMKLTIHQAQEIPAKERGGANNTQVRLLLLPTKKQRHKTKVKPGDNPMFEETFVFNKVSIEDVTGFGVRFRLYGTERMRRERMIGESIIGFASLTLDEPSTHWVILEPRSNLSGDSNADVTSLSRSDSASSTQSLQHGGMPELLLGLSYNGTTGRLSVEVIKGSNFRNMAMNRAPDTYAKLTLMAPNGTEVAHSKTSVRRGQPNPLFKETFMFQVAQFQLADVTLMVSVYNKKSMKKKEMIGWFALGLNSSGEEENSHWADMRESKGENICRWHVLLES